MASKIHQKTQSFAVFGELTHRFLDKWQLAAGLRLTYDKRNVDMEALGWDATTTRNRFVSEQTAREHFLLNTIPLQNRKDNWLQPSGRLALSYEIANEQIVYASFARGFKGGEFNGGALFNPAEATLTNPEFVNSFELGYKGRLFDNRLQLNASVFYMQFDEQQVFILASQQLPLQALANAASSEVKGVEAELQWLANQNWLFQLDIGYLDAKFDTFTDPIDPTNDLSGNRLPNSPKWSINGLVQYDWLLDVGTVRVQTDFVWYEKQFFTARNNPVLSQEPYGVVNGRLAFMTHDRKYEIALWVKNILDEDYFTAGFDQEALGWDVLSVGDPRTIEATLVVHFE